MSIDPLREEADIIYRLSKQPSRFCEVCACYTSHFAEFHKDDDEQVVDAHEWVRRCRQTRLEALRAKERTHGG